MTEQIVRLDIQQTGGFWLVDEKRVNLEDLCNAHESEGSAIVRVRGVGPVRDAICYMREDGPIDPVVSEDA